MPTTYTHAIRLAADAHNVNCGSNAAIDNLSAWTIIALVAIAGVRL